MVISNNFFSAGARILAESTNCELVDRETLASWIFHFQANSKQHFTILSEPKKIRQGE